MNIILSGRASLAYNLCWLGVLFALISAPVHAITMQPPDNTTTRLFEQFNAGGHVIGFQSRGVYIAGRDHVLRVEFLDAYSVAPVANCLSAEQEEQQTELNGRRQPVDKVTYSQLWNGVSVTYESSGGGIVKSSFRLDSGDDVVKIRLRYNVPLRMEDNGSLCFAFATGEMYESAPKAWQDIGTERIPVAVSFRVFPGHEVGFALGAYNPECPVVIDPTLQWNTFLGSGEDDEGWGIAVDANGNVYVTGMSEATWGSPIRTHSGLTDAFVAKLDTNGTLLWNTFLGSVTYDRGRDIAVDKSGNVYVTGMSYAAWGTPIRTYSGKWDAFAAKLDTNGALLWNTFLGSSADDEGYGVAVNEGMNVYVTGRSFANWGTPIIPYAGCDDGMVAMLSANGALLWNTFLGGTNCDGCYDIAVDGGGNVYVVGESYATWGTPIRDHAGGYDAFVAKLENDGDFVWNTFLGSTAEDEGDAIAVDGNVYVTGMSAATWGTPIRAYTGYFDAFVAKLDTNGALLWNTSWGQQMQIWAPVLRSMRARTCMLQAGATPPGEPRSAPIREPVTALSPSWTGPEHCCGMVSWEGQIGNGGWT